MKELKNRKTGAIYIVNDEEYGSLKENGRLKKFIVSDIEPIKKIIPIPGLIRPEVRVTKNKPKK